MKFQELKEVFEAVKLNVELLENTKGESSLVGLDNLSREQLEEFDKLYEIQARKAWSKLNA